MHHSGHSYATSYWKQTDLYSITYIIKANNIPNCLLTKTLALEGSTSRHTMHTKTILPTPDSDSNYDVNTKNLSQQKKIYNFI